MIQTRNIDPRTIRNDEILLMEAIPILFLFHFLNLGSRMVRFHGNKKKPDELRMLLIWKINCCLVPLAKRQDIFIAFRLV